MKIAITGHSRGLGKAIYELLLEQGHEVIGMSRSNGFNISTDKGLIEIIEQTIDCDVFINNAYSGMRQMDALNRLWAYWKRDKTKTIVNISSVSKYPGLSGNQSGYSAHKAALSHQAFLLMFKSDKRKCRMINVNPGFIRTEMTKARWDENNMLTSEECADMIAYAINQPQHIEIGEIGFWRTY